MHDARIDAAGNDLRQVLLLTNVLGLSDAHQIIDAYVAWCDLLHTARHLSAVEQLRSDMRVPATALARVQFAFAYDPEFDPREFLDHLLRRESLGGLTSDELRALITIRMNRNDARGVVELIARHRKSAEEILGRPQVLALEIHALTEIGDVTSAKLVLETSREDLEPSVLPRLQVEIAKAEGADPVVEHLRLYEETPSRETLGALVAALVKKGDHIGIARYAELLFSETHDPEIAALAAQATIKAGETDKFVQMYEQWPCLRSINPAFTQHYSWQLFLRGRYREAKQYADDLAREFPERRDLNLAIALSLETGEWKALADALQGFLVRAKTLTGLDLIRAAHLAQASGEGPLLELIDEALARNPEDPNVLLGAYTIYLEEDLEDSRPEAHDWFRKALALSGPEGPVQQFQLRDLLTKVTEWNKTSSEIGEQLTRGEMPTVIASSGLNTTVVDMILRNLVRNESLADARRRVAIPLFSGRRAPMVFETTGLVAFDITSLLVLGWLGILDASFKAVQQVLLPGGVLSELFDGRRRIRQAQRSRLRRAEEVRNSIAGGQLKVLRLGTFQRDSLASDVGIELAALLRAAESSGGVVVRSAPVRHLGLEERDADLSSHYMRLCDMHTLLKALVDLDVVDEITEASASNYFKLQDRGWPSSPTPDPTHPVYLDGLSVVYLQHTGLLQPLLRAFPDVYVHDSTVEEAQVLIEHGRHVEEVLRVIDDIRDVVRTHYAQGRLMFGPRIESGEDILGGSAPPSTLNLLGNLKDATIAVFDDRYLNREVYAQDNTGHRARTASTLDIIEILHSTSVLGEQERRTLRYRLRKAGAALLPVDSRELASATQRSRTHESPEFRAIRDSVDLARLSQFPQFPAELPWFLEVVRAGREAVTITWNEEADFERARTLASVLQGLCPVAEDWVDRWNGAAPAGWTEAARRSMIIGFVLPIGLEDRKKLAAYHEWIENTLLEPLRFASPETYAQVVELVKRFVHAP